MSSTFMSTATRFVRLFVPEEGLRVGFCPEEGLRVGFVPGEGLRVGFEVAAAAALWLEDLRVGFEAEERRNTVTSVLDSTFELPLRTAPPPLLPTPSSSFEGFQAGTVIALRGRPGRVPIRRDWARLDAARRNTTKSGLGSSFGFQLGDVEIFCRFLFLRFFMQHIIAAHAANSSTAAPMDAPTTTMGSIAALGALC